MKNKIPILMTGALALLCVSQASAVNIYINDIDADATISNITAITADSIDVKGSTTVTPSTTAGGSTNVSSQTIVFDITGLTIDGNGSGDDSVTFSIASYAWGVTIDTNAPSMTLDTPYTWSTNNAQYWGNTGPLPGGGNFNSSTEIRAGEGMSFAYLSGSVTLGAGATTSYTLSFDGFDTITYDHRTDGSSNSVYLLDGVATAITDYNTDAVLDLANADTFAIGSSSVGFRLKNLGFGVTTVAAVPEASAFGFILGALGLLWISYRRFSLKS